MVIMIQILKNRRGISIVGSIFAFLILGVMGASLVALVSNDQESRMRSIYKDRAFYATQAGLEYALGEIDQGGYPIVADKTIGSSTFTTTIKPSSRQIAVTGTSGSAMRAHSITAPKLASDCCTINVAGASITGGNRLSGVTLTKTCLTAVGLDIITVGMNPYVGELVTSMEIGGTLVYDSASGSPLVVDIDDFKVHNSDPINYIEFSSGISGKTIILTITFTDSSTLQSSAFTL
jgi:hypothetical protein